jgi:carbon starvation protein CstA
LFVALIAAAAIVVAIGYRIYSGILAQMAKNAKNKRIIKNEVTQWTGREYRRSRRR